MELYGFYNNKKIVVVHGLKDGEIKIINPKKGWVINGSIQGNKYNGDIEFVEPKFKYLFGLEPKGTKCSLKIIKGVFSGVINNKKIKIKKDKLEYDNKKLEKIIKSNKLELYRCGRGTNRKKIYLLDNPKLVIKSLEFHELEQNGIAYLLEAPIVPFYGVILLNNNQMIIEPRMKSLHYNLARVLRIEQPYYNNYKSAFNRLLMKLKKIEILGDFKLSNIFIKEEKGNNIEFIISDLNPRTFEEYKDAMNRRIKRYNSKYKYEDTFSFDFRLLKWNKFEKIFKDT